MVFISYTQQIDTSTPAVTLLAAAIAEFEREMIRERVKTGMANARREATRGGAPIGCPRISASKPKIRQLRKDGASYAQIAKELGLAKSCVFRYTKAEEAFALVEAKAAGLRDFLIGGADPSAHIRMTGSHCFYL